MNDTATAGGATGASLIPSTTDAFTIAHLVVLAIFALAVIAAIVWGMRLKRQRKAAVRDIVTHNEESANAAERDASEPSLRAVDGPDAGEAGTIARSPMPPVAPVATPDVASQPNGEGTASPAIAPAPIRSTTAPAAPVTSILGSGEPAADEASVDEPSTLADEPIAASGPLEAGPAIEAASEPATGASPAIGPSASVPAAPSSVGSPADAPVTTLKGLGPKLATRLGELGVTTVGQIAALSDDEAVRLDAQLGPFSGRITRDRWIEQARFLAAGDRAGFEAVFGRL